jgi:hypothetical protein
MFPGTLVKYSRDVSVHCPRISKFTKRALSLEPCCIHFWTYGFADVPELDGSIELLFDQGGRKTKKSFGKILSVLAL